jgi:hypothetical protein
MSGCLYGGGEQEEGGKVEEEQKVPVDLELPPTCTCMHLTER